MSGTFTPILGAVISGILIGRYSGENIWWVGTGVGLAILSFQLSKSTTWQKQNA